jgi:hypothetical protein
MPLQRPLLRRAPSSSSSAASTPATRGRSLYLRWLDERQAHENPPLGLILCADKNEEQIELLQLSEGSIRVARYLTELPPRALLEKKLLEAIAHARAQLGAAPPPSTSGGEPST